MIVRISEEGQFEIDEERHERLDELDNAVVAAVEGGDEAEFRRTFDALLDFIRAEGTVVADDDLRPSDVIVPPADLTFEEAGTDFSGEGLVPDLA